MKKQILFVMAAALTLTSSAFASDCRMRLIPTYDIQNYASINTAEIALDIAKYLDKKGDFTISSDADAPYVLQYSISASDSGESVVQFMMNYQSPNGVSSANAKFARNSSRKGVQEDLFEKAVKELKSRLPSCPKL